MPTIGNVKTNLEGFQIQETGYWDLNQASDLDSKSVASFRGDHKSQWAGPGGLGKKKRVPPFWDLQWSAFDLEI